MEDKTPMSDVLRTLTEDQGRVLVEDPASDEIEKRFGPYKKPTEEAAAVFKEIQTKTLELARVIDKLCPHSREKATALTYLKMARMSANESVALYSELMN